ILKRPNTYYAPLLISNYLAPYISDIELRKAFESLHGDALKMFQYKLLEEYIIEMDKKEGIGEKAIDFVLADVNGVDVKMYDLIKDKKYVLIDFWASWCVPCRNESKYLTQAYYKFNKKGFDILGVSLDKDRENWIKAIRNDGLIWTNVSDLRQWNSIIVKLYNLEAIPYNIIVDSKGNIIARNVRGENLITTLNQLFAE
ncbi:MAG: TlpA disulfide reductase family protein, partial [Bacteroidales bacterium]|nr:TlpA disulfide reductase family protein [Bacteroidales bacterium]